MLKKLGKKDSCPLQLLREDGDWSKEHFWAVVEFLKHASRFDEILQVILLLLLMLSGIPTILEFIILYGFAEHCLLFVFLVS